MVSAVMHAGGSESYLPTDGHASPDSRSCTLIFYIYETRGKSTGRRAPDTNKLWLHANGIWR